MYKAKIAYTVYFYFHLAEITKEDQYIYLNYNFAGGGMIYLVDFLVLLFQAKLRA
jgi:hypothetical protein